MGLILYLTFVFWFFLPAPAYAYLDPGTGNALVYMIVSFFGALIFSLKGLFYKIIGKKDSLENLKDANWRQIVIFSEGAAYWHTFRPIVKALLKKQVPFSYYTLDVDDPCLTMDEPTMDNRYIGSGSRAFAKIGNLKADLLLATTPNIGTPGYPVPKSPKIGNLVHVFHALDGLANYHRGSLDHYDAVLLAGAFEEPIIRRLEKMRNLPPKELIPAGLPYLDELAEKQAAKPAIDRTILIAPSWGEKNCLKHYGSKFIIDLVKANFAVIIRPHPHSWQAEAEFLSNMQTELAVFPQVTWDKNVDSTNSMQKAALLISDVSGVRVDFLVLQQKPVITLAMPMADMSDFEVADLGESWQDKALAKFCRTLDEAGIENIVTVAEEMINSPPTADIRSFRDENVYNWRRSGEVIAEYLAGTAEKFSKNFSAAKKENPQPITN